MDNIKNDRYYIAKIVKDLEFLIKHTNDISSIDDLNVDEVLLDSVLFRLIQVSENIDRVSIKLKDDNPQIPWKNIRGFRNRIVHDYDNVELNIVFEIVNIDIHDLNEMFHDLRLQ